MTGPAIITPDDDAYRAWLATQQPKPPKGPNIKTHDDAEYQAWLAKNGQQQSSAPPRSTLYNTLSTASDALIPFGIGRDIRAAYNAAGDALHGRDGFMHSFTANKDADLAGQQQLAEQHPYVSAVIDGLGTGAQIVGTAGLGAAKYLNPETENTALTTAGRIYNSGKQAAKTGAAVGAIQSLGNAPNRGGAGEQIATAAKGAAAGGAMGGLFGAGAAAFPVAADAASTAGSKMRQVVTDFANRVASRDNASAPAYTKIPLDAATIAGGSAAQQAATPKVDRASVLLIQRLVRAGMNPQQALDALGQIPANKPVSLMEIAGDRSQPVRELGKWVARTPSAGAADLRSAVEQRATPLPAAQRVLGDVSEAMGQPRQNLVAYEQALSGKQLANAKPHYDAAFGENTPPVPLTARVDEESPSLGELLNRPSLKSALNFHNTIAAEKGEGPLALPTGEPTPPPTPPGFSPEQWADAVKSMQKRGIPIPGSGSAQQGAGGIPSDVVKDASGAPLRLYHGTASNFTRFDMSHAGSVWDDNIARAGVNMTTDPDEAQFFANKAAQKTGGTPRVIQSHAVIKNPLRISDADVDAASNRLRQEIENDRSLSEDERFAALQGIEGEGDVSPALKRAVADKIRPHHDAVIVQGGRNEPDWYIVRDPRSIVPAAPSAGAAPPAGVQLKSLQQLKFKLDDMLGFAKQNGTLPDGTPATKAKLGAINQTRIELLNIMKAHSSDYAAGNASWAGDAAMQDALESGRDFLKRPISELQSEYPTLSPGEQAQHNIGAVSGPMRDRIFAGNATDRAKFLNSPDVQERLGVNVPGSRLDQLKKNVGVEHQIALTNQQIPNGSDTYANLQNDADVSHDVQGVQNAKNLLLSIISGRPKAALRATFNNVLQPRIDQYIHGMNEQAANALAPKLAAGMLSRQELVSVLEDLATKHDMIRRMSINSSPLIGSAVGAGAGLLQRNR